MHEPTTCKLGCLTLQGRPAENTEKQWRCKLHTGPLDRWCQDWLSDRIEQPKCKDLGVELVCIGTESLWVDVMALSPLDARWILRLAFGTGFPVLEVNERTVASD